MENKEPTFEQQQKVAYAFLDAFYNRADFGYDVKRWQPSDVNQTIIDMVNEMGNDISINTKVVAVASLLLTIANNLTSMNFIAALFMAAIEGKVQDVARILDITKDELIKERDKLKSDSQAWAVVISVMASRKQNIEMAFLGWI